MKLLKETDLIPGLTCEFEASGETNAEVQEKYAAHFDSVHKMQRSKMTQEQIDQIDLRAHELLLSQT